MCENDTKQEIKVQMECMMERARYKHLLCQLRRTEVKTVINFQAETENINLQSQTDLDSKLDR